ncbi:MAG: methylglyoxal synthase [Ahrensia sp.]
MTAFQAYTVAMVAHDQKKDDMVAFCRAHGDQLQQFSLITTGTTGQRIAEAMPNLSITRLRSGPLGGDQQIGAMIAEGQIDALVFFIDPLTAMPHDVDVKALMRLAVVYDIAMALNKTSAEHLLKALTHQSPTSGQTNTAGADHAN